MPNSSNIRYIVLLLFFQLGWIVRLNIIGSISLSEIFLLLYTFLYVWKEPLFRQIEFRKLTIFYISLFIVQCVMEFVVGNSLNNALKGMAVTVVSFCYVYFLIRLFLRDRSLVFWLLLFSVFSMILRGSNAESDSSVEEALEGESATYLKFFLAPLLIKIMLASTCVVKGRWSYYLFIYLGIIFVIAGARSSGVMTLLTGLIGWFIASGRMISLRKLSGYFLLGAILGYGLYIVYVDNILSGDIKAGNNEQILRTENPYNPINLLKMGRTETFVGFIAFCDKPLTGWGAWKSDSDLKYRYNKIVAKLKGSSDFDINRVKKKKDVIPSHSVLVGYGMYNGILAFSLMLWLFFYVTKLGIKTLSNNITYKIIVVYLLIHFFWNFIFSPVSHFRQSLPLDIAFILATFITCQEQRKEELQEIS